MLCYKRVTTCISTGGQLLERHMSSVSIPQWDAYNYYSLLQASGTFIFIRQSKV